MTMYTFALENLCSVELFKFFLLLFCSYAFSCFTPRMLWLELVSRIPNRKLRTMTLQTSAVSLAPMAHKEGAGQ